MSSVNNKTLFLIGPGYIGRAVAEQLIGDGSYNITTLVRREEVATSLAKDGIKSVFGDLDNKEIIQKQTEASDIVIDTATADHLPSVEAVLEGIRRRAAQNKSTIFIHTSGCSFLSDESESSYESDMIYSDKKPQDLDARPDSASHRMIDLAILKARTELGTKAKLFIVLPPVIYGTIAKHERLSIQIPTMARFALKHKYAGHVGKGKAVWSLVHVSDLARAYFMILQWLERSDAKVALEHPYFFCENGVEMSWGDMAAMIGKSLHAAGKVQEPAPKEIPRNDWDDLFGPYSAVVIGANARNRAERVRELGWQPEHSSPEEAFDQEELPLLLKETGDFNGYGRAAASGATN